MRATRVIYVAVAAAAILLGPACTDKRLSDYETDLTVLDRELASIPREAGPAARAEALYRRASLTGNPEDFLRAGSAADEVIRQTGPVEEFVLAKADLDLKRHRPVQAGSDLQLIWDLEDNVAGRTLQADIDLQRGRYADARRIYENVIEEEPTWDRLARLAYLESLTGDAVGADALYAKAEDEITAKELRAYAWVEVQRGALAFAHGLHEAAVAHYRRAQRAYSGYWAVEERIAELLGAQRHFTKAITLYRQVLARTSRPEIAQALGDLYAFMGEVEEAKPWHDRALAVYLESAQRGDNSYPHQLAGFYADVLLDGSEAVRWARKDLEQRRDPAAHDALAWALYRNGEYEAAYEEIRLALSSGIADANLYFHAAMISTAAGHSDEGRKLLQRTAVLNPQYTSFHAHR